MASVCWGVSDKVITVIKKPGGEGGFPRRNSYIFLTPVLLPDTTITVQLRKGFIKALNILTQSDRLNDFQHSITNSQNFRWSDYTGCCFASG